MATSYLRRSGAYKMIRSLLSLPLLPHAQIPDAFEELCRGVEQDQMKSLFAYVRSQWIEGTIHPSEWSVFRRLRRTNNHLEGYHNRLNTQAKHHKMKPFVLLELLDHEIELQEATMQMAQVNHQERLSTMDKALLQLWDRHQARTITTAEFLLEAGFPVVDETDADGEEEE